MKIFERDLTFTAEIIALNIWHQKDYLRRVRNSFCVYRLDILNLKEKICTSTSVLIIRVSTKISACFSFFFFSFEQYVTVQVPQSCC